MDRNGRFFFKSSLDFLAEGIDIFVQENGPGITLFGKFEQFGNMISMADEELSAEVIEISGKGSEALVEEHLSFGSRRKVVLFPVTENIDRNDLS